MTQKKKDNLPYKSSIVNYKNKRQKVRSVYFDNICWKFIKDLKSEDQSISSFLRNVITLLYNQGFVRLEDTN